MLNNDIPLILDCPNCKQNMLKGLEFLLQTFECNICNIKINFDIMDQTWALSFKNYLINSFGNIEKFTICNAVDPALIAGPNSKTYKKIENVFAPSNKLSLNFKEAYLYLLKFIENELFI